MIAKALPLDRQDAWLHKVGLAETIRQVEIVGQLGFQLALFVAAAGNNNFRTGVPIRARVVERVDGRFGLKMQIARPVHAFEHMLEKVWNVFRSQFRIITRGSDEEEFCQ